ncbi:MAG: ABC transporter ATP-binding protein [Desulfovermiculus sp.]|nr:ABC transporter ATP-binding protein [Desulfovermiculus sp.]
MQFLEVHNVTKRFQGFTAISNCSLEIPKGRITGLIGPNGAGKTTLFNCISSFLPLSEGSINFKGEDISSLPPHAIVQKGIARTFQVPHGFKRLTVLENLMAAPLHQQGEKIFNIFLRPLGYKQEEQVNKEKAARLLDKTQLAERRNDLVSNLTTGEARMLELARQLMFDPQLLLLDEPAAGVNPSVQEILCQFIMELFAEGMTFLIIDHNLEFITRLSHHIYVMNAGEIFFQGVPEEVMNHDEVKEIYLGRAA